MAVVTVQLPDASSSVAPAKLFKAFVEDTDGIFGKCVKKFPIFEEFAGADGSVKKINYNEDGENKFIMYQFEAADQANLSYNYCVIGASGFPEDVQKVSFYTRLVEASHGSGSIGKITMTYEMRDHALPLSYEEIENGKSEGLGFFRAVESFILSRPDFN